MSGQLDMVYDWMIRHGKKLEKKRVKVRDDIIYNCSRLAQIHQELATKKRANTRFSEHLVEEGLFNDVRAAQQALRLYALNTGTCKTDLKRSLIVELYEVWSQGKIVRKDSSKINAKLGEIWSTI